MHRCLAFATALILTLPLALVSTPSSSPVASRVIPESCPVTIPNHADPNATAWWYAPDGNWFSKDGIYVGMGADGTYPVIAFDDGREGGWNKWGLLRIPPEPVAITMTFLGTRTTGSDPQIEIPAGYENQPFQVTPFSVPEPGCWQFAITTPTRSLTVVLWIVLTDWWGTPIAGFA